MAIVSTYTYVNGTPLSTLNASTGPFLSTNRLSSAKGGIGRTINARGLSAPTTSDATTVFYRMVRVPTNSWISSVKMIMENYQGATVTTWTVNVGLAASNAPANVDGTPVWMQNLNVYNTTTEGVLVSPTFFADAVALQSATTAPVDCTFQTAATATTVTTGFYSPGSSIYPLWDAIQNGGSGRTTVAGYNEQTQGFGYCSETDYPLCSPANGGTVLAVPGDPGGWLDIGMTSVTISATAAVRFMMEVAYILGS